MSATPSFSAENTLARSGEAARPRLPPRPERPLRAITHKPDGQGLPHRLFTAAAGPTAPPQPLVLAERLTSSIFAITLRASSTVARSCRAAS